jgi:hypothetical protein
MREGRRKAQRSIVVAQAALVWGNFSAWQLEDFIETGNLDTSTREQRMEYNPDLVRQIVATGKVV